MRNLRFIFGSIVVALLCSFVALAQTGSIEGTVTDKSGAVIDGATVTAINLDTKATRVVTTSGTGSYSLPNLPAGHYELDIKKEGFRAFKVSNAVLTVAQILAANAQLEPGAVSEEVQVQGSELPPVDLDTAQVSNLVTSKQMQDLPLIVRDPYSLVLLSPGTSQTNTSLGGFTVNGSRERNNNFLLDGVDNNDTSVPGIAGGVLSANPDSTEEFRVITNNFNAEYGRNTGAIVDVVTKSGTNQFHGDAYEFGRWNSFGGARDWFNRSTNPDGSTNPMNPYIRNQFGYSIGGPIIKNKTFFFFNHEIQRFRTTLTNSTQVPTAAFKTGVFNYTAPDNVTGQVETVPVDLTQNGANNGTGAALGANAPEDPTMQKVLGLFPNPTLDNGDGLTGTLLFPSSSRQNSYQAVAKLDHHFTDRESVSVRFGYDDFIDPNPFHLDELPGGFADVNEKSINRGLSAHLTSTLTNSLINDFAFGWNSIYSFFGCTGVGSLDSLVPLDQFGNGWDFNFDAGGFTSLGCTALVSNNQWRKTGTTSYGDALTWVKGAHTFKFGSDFRNIGEQGPDSFFSRRQVDLNPLFNFNLPVVQGVPNDTSSLESAAAAYYGLVAEDFQAQFFNKGGVRQATDNKHFRQHEYDWFAQDQWKIRPNFTLNIGLRYQLDGVPFEEGANFSNLLQNPGFIPAGQPVTLSIVGPGTGNSLFKQDYSNFEPRVGISWDPFHDGKTSVRAAFGIFHDRLFGNAFGNARGNPPFEQDWQRFPLDTINGFYGGNINGPFPLPAPPLQIPSATIPFAAELSPVLFDTHFRNEANNNWNFGIQRELAGNNVLDVAYIGSEGHHILREQDGNPPDPNLVNQLVTFCSTPNAFNCTPNTVTHSLIDIGADFGLLPFNGVVNDTLFQPFYQVSNGNSFYGSLQAKITHRMSHGLQIQGSYTYAHGIDDSNDPLVQAQGNRGFPRNSRNLREERGNSDFDIRHIAVVNYIWEVPLGRGKGFLSNGVIGKIFEGWQFSGITTAQTGHPFDVFTTTDMERTGLSGRADLIGNPFVPGTNTAISANGNKVWFTNPAAFSDRCAALCPEFVGPGSVGRNHFYGPHFIDFDLAWEKNTKITERVNAQLRVEGYNIFNHPHFNNPGADLSGNLVESPIFGLITSTATRPDATTSNRQLQVALKVSF